MSRYSKDSHEFNFERILAKFQSGDSIVIKIFPGYIFTLDNKFKVALKKSVEDKCKENNDHQEKD